MAIKNKEDFEKSSSKVIGIDNGSNIPNYSNYNNALNSNNNQASNEDVYAQLQRIANGDYSNGNNNAYGKYQANLNKYDSLKNVDTSKFSTGQMDYYNTLLAQANGNVNNAKSYYDQYLANEKSNIASKNAQYEAQQNALKYAQAQLNASGYANQGLAESTRAGINNNYARNIAGLDASNQIAQQSLYDTYMKASRDDQLALSEALAKAKATDKAELQAKQNEDYETYNSLISSALSKGDLYKANSYYDRIKDSLTENQRAVIEAEINDAQEEYNAMTTDELLNTSYVTSENKTENINARFNHEVTTLNKQIQDGNVQNGDVVQLTNKWGENIYLKYQNGKFQKVSKEDYTRSNKSLQINDTTFSKGSKSNSSNSKTAVVKSSSKEEVDTSSWSASDKKKYDAIIEELTYIKSRGADYEAGVYDERVNKLREDLTKLKNKYN